MPVRSEVRRLGSSWHALIERVGAFAATIPSEGVPLAVLERATMLDVAPSAVQGIVEALHGKGVIWARKNRGEVRIFQTRPVKIAGTLGTPEPVEAYLSASVPHVHRLASNLRRREQAKRTGDHGAAQEARADVAVCCQRVVRIAKGHVSRGVPLADIRRAMWAVYPEDVMAALASFEAAFERRAQDASFEEDESPTKLRIASRLPLQDKVAALVGKAGAAGVTKTDLYQAIRPKPCSAELGAVLDELSGMGRIDVRRVRVVGSEREGLRYFR